jgi:hypothetical protein
MTLEGVKIKKAEELPLRLQQEHDIYSGLVEVRYEKNSPVKTKVSRVDGTFADKLKEKLKERE